MKLRDIVSLPIGIAASAACAVLAEAEPITSAADVAARVYLTHRAGETFVLSNVLVTIDTFRGDLLAVREVDVRADSPTAQAAILHHHRCPASFQARAGDIARVSGHIRLGGEFDTYVIAEITNYTFLAHVTPPEVPSISAREFFSGRCDCQPVRITGRVRDLINDEIDCGYRFLVLDSDGETIYVPCKRERISLPPSERLIGAVISAVGICDPSDIGGRRRIGRLLAPYSSDAITIVTPPPADPFAVPDLTTVGILSPAEIATLGPHRTVGTVLAALDDNRIVLRNQKAVVNISLAEGFPARSPLPAVGSRIEAVGYPETDLYRLNLVHARWQPAADNRPGKAASVPAAVPRARDLRDLTDLNDGRRQFKPYAHGWRISLEGLVYGLHENDKRIFHLDCNGTMIPVDFTGCPDGLGDLTAGCRVEVGGICVMDTGSWQPNQVFPQIRGFTLAVAKPDDITILARPPWWTPSRLLIIIGALVLALAAFLIWNRILRRLVERRSRALFKSQIAKVESQLRVDERTRLAADLHDTLSQNLTAISFQLSAGDLQTADRMLHSCRAELRRCLWDLKSDALDEPDFNTAIRRTVEPVLRGATLSVRFNVARSRMNDITAHTILSILRELAANAVRHGNATRLRIAGTAEARQSAIVFSLADNGCGFDPGNCPGPLEGHFGLNGIRDRLGRYEGSLTLRTAPGGGTIAVVKIKNADKTNSES